MGLFLPQAPPPDSDEEEDPEGAAARRSHASIPMDAGEKKRLTSHLSHTHTFALVLCQCEGPNYT